MLEQNVMLNFVAPFFKEARMPIPADRYFFIQDGGRRRRSKKAKISSPWTHSVLFYCFLSLKNII